MLYDAVIIGAGHNGLVAAAYLARAGKRVCVLESHEEIGGATVSEHPWPGWTVSAASYVCSLLHPDIIADLDLPSHGYTAYRKAAASFTPLLDGRSLLLTRDDDANAREIAAFNGRDVDGYRALEVERSRLGRLIFDAMNDVRDLAICTKHRKIHWTPVPFFEACTFRFRAPYIVLLNRHGICAFQCEHPCQGCPEIRDARC